MLIDWLTLRTSISDFSEQALLAISDYLQGQQTIIRNFDLGTEETVKVKLVVDIDKVRSDFTGMVWSISTNGKDKFLNIGASPAYLLYGRNIFGTMNYQVCKAALVDHMRKNLSPFLPQVDDWEVRRIDVTNNYFMDTHAEVKEALRMLRCGDGNRQKTTVSYKGDTVNYGLGSTSRSGKTYDKGEQAEYLNQKHKEKTGQALYTQQELEQLMHIIRNELKLGRQFIEDEQARYYKQQMKLGRVATYRDFEIDVLTESYLEKQHHKFFDRYIGKLEVTDMETLMNALHKVIDSKGNPISHGQALAAHKTWALIRSIGYESTKASMPKATFMRHQKYLLDAGLSQSDLQSAVIVPFRRKTIELSSSVDTWEQLTALFKQAKAA